MPSYKAPIRDISFVLKELYGLEVLQKLKGGSEITDDLIDAILTEVGRFCENVLFPLNQTGDKEGCRYENGEVRTPKGFKEAYNSIVESGWASLSCEAEWGGQGLPHTLNTVAEEMICAANIAFGLYPGLTRGAYALLSRHGSEELKRKFLPNMVKGKWSGTMCLTEAHCGTDLGMLRTKAVPDGTGAYKISGTKIFISSGEHDLTENILHFVIARAEGAPAGIKGISLFLVPKFIVKDDGSLGKRNNVQCASIEHKMGIKGSATAVMNFDDAEGYLVGELNEGVSKMFTMMNLERLSVGNQGQGVADIAYQNALSYAKERLQGRALTGVKFPDKAADPIIVHPDVRRMLLTMKTYTESNRMLALWVAMEVDKSERSEDPEVRQIADDLVHLMTPIVKAFLTDVGFDMTNIALQVFGGHGYIQEHGMEQFVRDSRITQIYEGTNGIQALDLMGRKMSAHFGRYLRAFFHPVQQFIEEHQNTPELAEFMPLLAKAFGRLQQVTATIAQKGMSNPNEIGAAATDYLHLFAHVAVAYLWARAVLVAMPKVNSTETAFYQGKIDTARFFYQKLLPKTSSLFASIMAGSETLMKFKDESFGPF